MLRIGRLCQIVGISLCFYGAFGMAYGLEVVKKTKYYTIDPDDLADISRETQKYGPKTTLLRGRRASGLHSWNVDFFSKITYKRQNGQCAAVFAEPILYTTITVPRLEKSKYRYDTKLVDFFQSRTASTLKHEETHRRYAIEHVTRAERAVRALMKQHKGNCVTLRKRIKAKYNEVMAENTHKNRLFDCQEYGFAQKYSWCAPYAQSTIQVKKKAAHTKLPTFSSDLKKQSKTQTRVIKDPKTERCDGQLIEPFKGTFYCVTGAFEK